jgi:hypothetical protein
MKSSQVSSDICDPILYRLYFGLMAEDILFHLGFEPTAKNKEILHEFHKRVLGYSTISGRKEEVVSRFLQEVTIFWSVEKGIFVRTSRKQPLWIELMGFSDIVKVEGKEYTVRELL